MASGDKKHPPEVHNRVRPPRLSWRLNRRDFMQSIGLAGAAASSGWLEGCEPVEEHGSISQAIQPEFGVYLTRPEDFVYLRVEFSGLDLVNGPNGRQLVPDNSNGGYVIYRFQPQHFLEEAISETTLDAWILTHPGTPPPASELEPPPLSARLSAQSRVVVKVPAGSSIPYHSEGLLDALRKYELSLAATAAPVPRQPVGFQVDWATPSSAISRRSLAAARRRLLADGVDVGTDAPVDPDPPRGLRPAPPTIGETAIEIPYRVQLSPNVYGRWLHVTRASEAFRNNRYELWHSRLGILVQGRVTEAPTLQRAVRAIWTRDYEQPWGVPYMAQPTSTIPTLDPSPPEFSATSLIPDNRHKIVQQSTNSLDWSYEPRPIKTEQLMLSSLGGWLKARGHWGQNAPTDLVSWDHHASMGRDYFVKVVTKGYLVPFGHEANLITITERRFKEVPAAAGNPRPPRSIAYLWQYCYIEITQPVRNYPVSPSNPAGEWRLWPCQSVRFKTLVTPKLLVEDCETGSDQCLAVTHMHVRSVTGAPFLFKVELVDSAGNLRTTSTPVGWVKNNNLAGDPGLVAGAVDCFNEYTDQERTLPLSGQRYSYARNTDGKPDDTTFETQAMRILAAKAADAPSGVTFPNTGVPFLPVMDTAYVQVEALRTMIGQSGPIPVTFALPFLRHEFASPGNAGEVLFEMPPLPVDFSKQSDSVGGIATPGMDAKGIGRKTQLVGDDPNAVASSAQFDPASFLGDVFLFGAIKLSDIIPVADLDKAPKFVSQTLDVVTNLLADANFLIGFVDKLGGAAPVAFNQLKSKLDAVIAAIEDLLPGGDPPHPDDVDIADAVAALNQLPAAIQNAIDALGTLPIDVIEGKRQDLKRRLQALSNLLQSVHDALVAFAAGLEMAKNLTVRFDWETPLEEDPLGFFEKRGPDTQFVLAVEIRGKQVGDNPAGVSAISAIQNFKLRVFGKDATLLTIPFKHVMLKFESNKKPEIDVLFDGDVDFDGILAFINTLAQLIPGGGFSDPPAVEVTSEGITASFSVPIPSISVGVFSIQNMRLGAGFNLPFIGDPLTINFFFCTREEPFVLTVMMIGGGGFVNLAISPRGMELLEAAFEARAQLGVDFGVASGSISLAVGVYFRLEIKNDQQAGELTGYIRFNGQISVLGIISASLTLMLELTYQFETEKLWGRATLTIEVSILFFSVSVEVVAERKLAGNNDDPTFLDQFEPDQDTGYDPWQEYLEAFTLAA